MTDFDLDSFTLAVIDRVRRGAKMEDGRVELKGEWTTDPARMSRQLAGHCNASGSDWVVWIVGMREDGTWCEDAEVEVGPWVARLEKHFDQGMPRLLQDLKVFVEDRHVTALRFEATRRPYVWRITGKTVVAHDAVTLEVPWRSGAATASARHEDLVRMLAPMAGNPTIELTGGFMMLHGPGNHPYAGRAAGRLELYFTPSGKGQVVLPFHKMDAMLTSPHNKWKWRVQVGDAGTIETAHWGGMVRATRGEVIIDGPGSAILGFEALGLTKIPEHILRVELELSYRLVGQAAVHRFVAPFVQVGEDMGTGRWSAMPEGGLRMRIPKEPPAL